MSHDDYSDERCREVIRSMRKPELEESFRFMGLTLNDMDRLELLGIICFLVSQQPYGPFSIFKRDK